MTPAASAIDASYRPEYLRELAARYRAARLLSRFGAAWRAGLDRMGLDSEVVQSLMLGVSAEDPFDLLRRLAERGASLPELARAGVTDPVGRDRFHGMLVVPLVDVSGRIVDFLPFALAWFRHGGTV